jgi:hemerythrin-like domain-containing protein
LLLTSDTGVTRQILEGLLSGRILRKTAGLFLYRGLQMMITRLLAEHDHIRKTLNLLEMQFLDLCRGRTPDYSMMLSIVVYIQEYPEQAHHPLEDAVFSILIDRGSEQAQMARSMIKDHTELEIITRSLRESLELLKSGKFCSEEDLKKRLMKFLSRQRQHLYAEETSLYPLIRKTLTEKDWGKIESMVPHLDDPVFGARTRSDYERLSREIESRSG